LHGSQLNPFNPADQKNHACVPDRNAAISTSPLDKTLEIKPALEEI
jgi:hypothetical protein